MEAKTKKIIFVVGAIFVAIIFLTSYAAFSNNNTGSTSTTTVESQATYFSTGTSNAIITNYSDIAYVTLSNSVNSSKINMTTILSGLETNGSVDNYVYTNGSYEVVLSSISAYDLQELLYKDVGSNTFVNVGATTYVELPQSVVLYYTTQPITVNLPSRNYSIYLKNVQMEGSTVNVSISGLLERNGTIYNSQFRVAYNPNVIVSNSSLSNSTTTIKAPATYIATGTSNAVITGYGKVANVTLSNSINTTKVNITKILSQLESNKSVGNYIYTNGTYDVVLSNISAYNLQNLLYKDAGSSNTISVGSTANVELPSNVVLYNATQSITVVLSNRNYSIYLKNVQMPGSTVNVSISAQLEKNGTIYNNQFKVAYK
jgi:hypothetical protein